MPGIIEKSSSGNGLFENEIEFTGKYATYVRYLKDEAHIFNTYRDVYVMGAILGFLEGKKGTIDAKDDNVDPASIFPAQLAKFKQELKFIYRIIMLLDESDKLSLEDRKNRAFRDDPEENKETIKANMALFNDYVCGGVEYLYSQFELNDPDDLTAKIKKLNEFLYVLSIKNHLIEDKELPDFDPSVD